MPLRLASKSVRCPRADRARAGRRVRGDALLHAARGAVAGGARPRRSGRRLPDRRPAPRCASWPAGPRERVTVMVDCAEHLDWRAPPCARRRRPVRVCLDVDAGWRPLGGRLQIGAKRSPLHTPEQAAALAREIVARPELELDGLMGYEAQIAGVGDRPPGRPLMGVAMPRDAGARRRASWRGRRAAVVAAVRAVAPLRFVNGGGTGSIERTAAEPAVTEVAAGLGPLRADAVRRLPRVHARARRRCSRCRSCAARGRGRDALGGGYPASGAAGARPAAAPVCRPGCGSTARRARARSRRRCSAGAAGAAGRRPRVVPPRQGGRAVRALRRACTSSAGDELVGRPCRPTAARGLP